jgi:hypothetical protein
LLQALWREDRDLRSTLWQASPLVVCGALKIAYDLLLLNQFRYLKPPEER